MNPRQRVHAILDRKPVDRIPIDIWTTPEIFDLLVKHTGAENELDMYRRLGVDKMLWAPLTYDGPMRDVEYEGGLVSLFGCQMKPVKSGAATYLEYADHPLDECETIDDLDKYPYWPDPDKFDIDGMAKWIEERCGEFPIMGPWISFYEIYCGMRGLENAMIDLLEEPEFVMAACDRIEHIQTVMLKRLCDKVGNKISCFFISDDMGSQHSLMISLDAWREFFQPRMKRWCDMAHSYGITAFYHSDGAIDPLIQPLIDTGVDLLNPIQHECPGMEMKHLKSTYGDRLMFHGAIDTQKVLPRGTVDEVIEETKNCLETLGAGGGYICGSCHNIQPDTPLENILAMIETVRKSSL